MKPTSALTAAGHLWGCRCMLCLKATLDFERDIPKDTFAGALDFITAMRGPLADTPCIGASAEVLEFLRPAIEAGVIARAFVVIGLPCDMVILTRDNVGRATPLPWQPSEVRVVRVLGFSQL